MKSTSRFLLFCFSFFFVQSIVAQTVTGTVVDEYNEALPSVVITVENQNGTMTDYNGQYTLNLPKGTHNITYSFIGYEPVTKRLPFKAIRL